MTLREMIEDCKSPTLYPTQELLIRTGAYTLHQFKSAKVFFRQGTPILPIYLTVDENKVEIFTGGVEDTRALNRDYAYRSDTRMFVPVPQRWTTFSLNAQEYDGIYLFDVPKQTSSPLYPDRVREDIEHIGEGDCYKEMYCIGFLYHHMLL